MVDAEGVAAGKAGAGEFGSTAEFGAAGDEAGEDGEGGVEGHAGAEEEEEREGAQAALPIRVEGVLAEHVEQGGDEGEQAERAWQQGAEAAAQEQERREQEHEQHEGVRQVLAEVEGGHDALAGAQGGAPEGAQEAEQGAGTAAGPAGLLLFPGGDLRGDFGGDDDIGQVEEAPAGELGTIAEVEVFGEGEGAPAARFADAGHAPDAAGAAEVHEPAGAVAGGLLDDEVAVEGEGLAAGEGVIEPVEMAPAGLDHADLFVGDEVGDGAAEEVRRGDEVGVEHGEQFTIQQFEAAGKSAGLVATALRAADMADIKAAGAQAGQGLADEGAGIVDGIVEDLDSEQLPGQ